MLYSYFGESMLLQQWHQEELPTKEHQLQEDSKAVLRNHLMNDHTQNGMRSDHLHIQNDGFHILLFIDFLTPIRIFTIYDSCYSPVYHYIMHVFEKVKRF